MTESRVRLSWRPARRRSGRLAGYRIFRDGLPVRQVRGRAGVDRDLAPATRYRFTVAAIDTQGYMSASTARCPSPPRGRRRRRAVPTRSCSPRPARASATSSATTREIGTLYPTYFDCRASDGAITGRDDPLVTRWSQLRGILVLPRFNCQREDTLHRILTDATRALRDAVAARGARARARLRRHQHRLRERGCEPTGTR